MKRLLIVSIGLFAISSFAQTESRVTFTRSVIPRPRSVPPLHYWDGIDDQNNGIVALTPTPASATSPGPNGYGIIILDSGGFSSHRDDYWIGDEKLNGFQACLQKGYTIFIVTHPPSSFSQAGFPQLLQPGYVTPEIREFLSRSIIALKSSAVAQANIFDPVTMTEEWHDNSHYGIYGGSSGGNLALYLGLQRSPNILAENNVPVLSSSGAQTQNIDAGIGAIVVGAPGVDALNWRFIGDNSAVWRNAQGLAHADLSHLSDPNSNPPANFPVPSLNTLPSHPNVGGPFNPDMPQSGPIEDALNYQLHSLFLPEIYLKKTPSATGNIFAADYVDPLQIDSTHPISLTDSAFNQSIIIPSFFPPLPSIWSDYLQGRSVIDLLDQVNFRPYPPIRWYYGECDSVVPEYQAKRFDNVFSTLPAPPAGVPMPILEQYVRTGQKHTWRDMDQKLQEEICNFFDKHLRDIEDKDLDGLDALVDSDDTNPDLDGDGQMDGAEYRGVGSALDLVNDKKTFRVVDVSKMLDLSADPHKWIITFTFEGFSGVSASDYELQSSTWLFHSSNDHDRYFPHWKKQPGAGVVSTTAVADRFTIKTSRSITAPSDEKFYRIALKHDYLGKNFRAIATAPVGLERGLIKRDPAGLDPFANLITLPFRTPQIWRGTVNSASGIYTGANSVQLVDWTIGAGAFSTHLSSLASPSDTNTGRYKYYAKVESDANVVGNRPTANPDEQGFAGHWWFVDSTATNVGNSTQAIRLEHRDSKTGIAGSIPIGSNVSVRPLASLADFFSGLERPLNPPGGTSAPLNHWYRAFVEVPNGGGGQVSVGTKASPFVANDEIRVLGRATSEVDWGQSSSFMRSTLSAKKTLTYVVSNLTDDHGAWQDLVNAPGVAIDLSTVLIRPDEAVEYLAAPTQLPEAQIDTEYWVSGGVPTSDVFAYLNGFAEDPMSTTTPATEWTPSTTSGSVYYGTSIVGWPFPQDCRLFSQVGQSSHFFESGLVTDAERAGSLVPNGSPGGTFISNLAPPSDDGSVVLFYSDYEDPQIQDDDVPAKMRIAWGGYHGDFRYWETETPRIRFLNQDTAPAVSSDNRPTGSVVEEPTTMLRAGRGCLVLINRADTSTKVIREWRMRRPYRRP
ncbi:MAG: hypothetical protein ACI97A_003247 [Planctomycetota bacterium]|jgi:hypothetical protein